jgi:hypothetical protein
LLRLIDLCLLGEGARPFPTYLRCKNKLGVSFVPWGDNPQAKVFSKDNHAFYREP